MKKLILLLFLIPITSLASDKCKITTFHQIIKINPSLDDSIIKDSNCSEEINSTLINFIETANGKLQSEYLSQYFKNEYQLNIEFYPNAITISHIKDHILDSISNPDAVIKNITSMLPSSAITLAKGENLKINCNNCNKAGSKNIAIEFENKKYWLNAKLYLKRKTFVLTKNIISLNERLDESYFKSKTILDDGSFPLFNNIDHIKFYQLTRFLKQGDVLKRGDLTPREVIRFGQKVNLNFKSENIELNSTAVANANGKFGDFIPVINPRSKKKFLAKVVDFNKVEVEQ